MKSLKQIRAIPMLLLTPDEINQLSPHEQRWAHQFQATAARYRACAKHEPVGSSTLTGWHSLRCKHCGMNMSYDSGD